RDYYFTGTLPLQGSVVSNLSATPGEDGLVNGSLAGSISLDLPFDLANAMLIGPKLKTSLGDISGHGTLDAAQLMSHTAPPSAPNPGNYLAKFSDEFLNMESDSAQFGLNYR